MEDQKRTITVEEAVAMAKDKLMCIAVPAGLSRQIGLPIEEVIGMLQDVQDAWMREKLERNKKAEREEQQKQKVLAGEADGDETDTDPEDEEIIGGPVIGDAEE